MNSPRGRISSRKPGNRKAMISSSTPAEMLPWAALSRYFRKRPLMNTSSRMPETATILIMIWRMR